MIDARTQWWREPGNYATHNRWATTRTLPVAGVGVSFWALMGFTFILLLAPQERFPVLAPLRIAMVAALVAISAHVFNRLSRDLPLIAFSPAIKFVLLLAAWALITVPLSQWPAGSLTFLTENYFKTVIVFVLLTSVVDSPAALTRITWGLVLMCIPLAVTTLLHFVSGTMSGGARVVGYMGGLTSNPNDLALMLNLILPLCIALFLSSRKTSLKILLAAIAGLLVVAIIATFSRAGFLTLAVTILTYSWFLRKRAERVWVPVMLVLGLLTLPVVPSSYIERVLTIVHIEEDKSGSAQTRLGDMKAAMGLAVTHPIIGAGIGMNALAMNEARGTTWTEVHNVYLQYQLELGLPGLILFVLLYLTCFKATGHALRDGFAQERTGNLFHITEGLRVSLIAFAFAAMFHPVAYHFYFYYIGGLSIAAGSIFSQGRQTP